MMADTSVRVHIWVQGRVQGVGFRAYVADCALKIGIKGWVRNVNWDTVETIAEGSRTQIDDFIKAVKAGPRSSRVDQCQVEEETCSAEFLDFEIRSSR